MILDHRARPLHTTGRQAHRALRYAPSSMSEAVNSLS